MNIIIIISYLKVDLAQNKVQSNKEIKVLKKDYKL